MAKSHSKNLVAIGNANAFNSDTGPHFLIFSDHCIKPTKTIEHERFVLSSVNVGEKQQ